METKKNYDIHCHFFNRKVLSVRLLVDLLMILSKNALGIKSENAIRETESAFSRILHFVKIGFSSSEEILEELEKDEEGFIFCPLMFDLDKCVVSSTKRNGILNEMTIAEIENNLIEELTKYVKEGNLSEGEELLDYFKKDKGIDRSGLVEADNFVQQETQIRKLKSQYPDKIFPFFVVDPRRNELFSAGDGEQSIVKIIERLEGGFAGIKLYTPNGYSPADCRLLPLYEYCEKYQIPITAHCSMGGFATFSSQIDINGPVCINEEIKNDQTQLTFKHNRLIDSERVIERANALNHPKLWKIVLEQYPQLKLNLAHFGSHETNEEWTESIFGMMSQFKNLYTDFSCVCEKQIFDRFYNNYYCKAEESVKQRFLYGSDFYLNILFIGSMKTYLRQFKNRFTPEEWIAIAQTNPKRFLERREKNEL